MANPEYDNHIRLRLISVDYKNKSAVIEVFKKSRFSWKQYRGAEGKLFRDEKKQSVGVWLEEQMLMKPFWVCSGRNEKSVFFSPLFAD
jgi:hypothetical protein